MITGDVRGAKHVFTTKFEKKVGKRGSNSDRSPPADQPAGTPGNPKKMPQLRVWATPIVFHVVLQFAKDAIAASHPDLAHSALAPYLGVLGTLASKDHTVRVKEYMDGIKKYMDGIKEPELPPEVLGTEIQLN